MSLILSGTDGLSDIDGSAATPAIRGTDANTGIFFPAADTIAFSEGGVESMRIDSSGRVGIGITSPSTPLHIQADSSGNSTRVQGRSSDGYADMSLYNNANTVNNAFFSSSNTATFLGTGTTIPLTFQTNNTERARIDSSGNVQVGTTTRSNDEKLTVFQSGSAMGISVRTTGGPALGNYESADNSRASYWTFGRDNASTGNFVFANNGTQRAAIDTSGNLLVGSTSTSATSGVGFKAIINDRFAIVSAGSTGATTSLSLYSTGASAFRFFVQDSGNINATSTSITAISDISLKENVRDLETGLTQVMALKPRRFDWKAETHLQEKNIAGFIAQEVEQVLPELVYDYQYNATEIKKSLKMGDILPTLVKAIQEQQALIVSMREELDALKTKVGA